MKIDIAKTLRIYAILTLGAFIIAAGNHFFKFPNNFSTGGVTGMSVVLSHYFPSLSTATFVSIINYGLLGELGYTVLKKDAEGNDLPEIDWTKTTAIATRGNHIWINLKGRNDTGIVDPADKYELERKIIDDLYNYRDAKSGKRVVGMAIRNKEAAIIGMSGPDCGDIIYFLDEGCNRVHGDSLSTYFGQRDTSVSPIYISAGKGLKKGCLTDRVVRQVDFAPTLAYLGGVRMPAQCEGAPLYQLMDEEF